MSIIHFYHQVALVTWILITCQVILVDMFGGSEYNPHVSCQWTDYYPEEIIFSMVVQFITFSSITFVSYISIFTKIKIQQTRRQGLGQ